MQEFKYQPPMLQLAMPLLWAGMAATATARFILDEYDYSFESTMSIVAILSCVLAILAGLIHFLYSLVKRKRSSGGLILGDDFIEINGPWKKPAKMQSNQITHVGNYHKSALYTEIRSKYGALVVEQRWMNKDDFLVVRKRLFEWFGSNHKG